MRHKHLTFGIGMAVGGFVFGAALFVAMVLLAAWLLLGLIGFDITIP